MRLHQRFSASCFISDEVNCYRNTTVLPFLSFNTKQSDAFSTFITTTSFEQDFERENAGKKDFLLFKKCFVPA